MCAECRILERQNRRYIHQTLGFERLILSIFHGVKLVHYIYSSNCTVIKRQYYVNTRHSFYVFRPTMANVA